MITDDSGSGLIWSNIAGSGESGNFTNGSGDAASVSSDKFGHNAFDTSLFSPVFSFDGFTAAELSFTANYQNFAGYDDLEVNLWSGGSQVDTLLAWNEDHGVFRTISGGEDVLLNLNAYSGMSNLQIAFRYFDPNPDAWDWYAQVDNVLITADPTDPVPEPATILLIGTGLVGLAGARLRRKK